MKSGLLIVLAFGASVLLGLLGCLAVAAQISWLAVTALAVAVVLLVWLAMQEREAGREQS